MRQKRCYRTRKQLLAKLVHHVYYAVNCIPHIHEELEAAKLSINEQRLP